MTRRLSASESFRKAKAKRDLAIERGEFRYPSAPRASAESPTSFPLKMPDPETARLVAEFLAKRDAR